MVEPRTVMQYIRGTRALPPGFAANDESRRLAYGAALEQFEQLMSAAQVVTPAARPLPLYYALSQAGRALIAAFGDIANVRTHGLDEDFSVTSDDVLRRVVKRKPYVRTDTEDPDQSFADAFGAVSEAIDSAPFGGAAEIGALWCALAPVTEVPKSMRSHDWLPSVGMAAIQQPLLGPTHVHFDAAPAGVDLVAIGGHPTLDLATGLATGRYGALAQEVTIASGPTRYEDIWHGRVMGAGGAQLWRSVETISVNRPERFLLPALGEGQESLRPIMLWWMLLFGLSVFSRYRPGLWVTNLRIDESGVAAALEILLDQALVEIPELVYTELYRGMQRERATAVEAGAI